MKKKKKTINISCIIIVITYSKMVIEKYDLEFKFIVI